MNKEILQKHLIELKGLEMQLKKTNSHLQAFLQRKIKNNENFDVFKDEELTNLTTFWYKLNVMFSQKLVAFEQEFGATYSVIKRKENIKEKK